LMCIQVRTQMLGRQKNTKLWVVDGKLRPPKRPRERKSNGLLERIQRKGHEA